MTVNFKNSAGTDLDSLFSITNSNAGALGFKEAGGQDLGNRFAAGSLGTNIGYKNSAGTDIGYLRGKVVAPTATVSLSPSSSAWGSTFCCDTDTDGNCTSKGRSFSYTLVPKVTITNGMPVTNIAYKFEFGAWANSHNCSITFDGKGYTLNAWKTWQTITTINSTELTLSKSFSAMCKCGISTGEYHTRVTITVTNSAGSNTYVTNTCYTNEDT